MSRWCLPAAHSPLCVALAPLVWFVLFASGAAEQSSRESVDGMLTEWQFWSLCWGLSASAGVARALRDSDYDDLLSLASVGLFSGLFGFAMVSLWVGSRGGHIGNEFRYLGLATLLGLLGKEQDRLVRYVINKTLTKVGVPGVPESEGLLGDDKPLDRHDSLGDSDSVEHCG